MTEPQTFKLAGAVLRPPRPGDEASIARNADNRKIWRNVRDLFPHPYSEADAIDFISRHQQPDPGEEVVLAIEIDGEAVGVIGLHPRTDVYRRGAELGYWLGEPYWGRGIVTEAVRCMTRHGFDGLGLVRIEAAVFEWNPASMRVLEKAGYVREARRRKAVFKDGVLLDEIVYAALRDEWHDQL